MGAMRVFVSDVAKSAAFYCGRLGFEELERWGPAFAVLRWEDSDLWLSGPGTSAAQPMSDGSAPEPGGWNRIVIKISDLEGTVGHLKAAGCKFRNEIVTGPGGKQIVLDDPDGNPVELFEPRA